MLIRTTILAQMILLVTTAGIQLPSESHVAADLQTPVSVTTSMPKPVVDPAGIYGADEDMEQRILDAMERYADAGLELPELRIYVHNSRESCKGHMGLYNKGGDQHRIDLCERYRKVITHEMAHAWEYHNVADSTREAFLDRAELRVWNDKNVPHPARGVEQVAWAISWGLEDQPIQSVLLNHHAEDLDRFELLIGTPSPRIAHLDAAVEDTVAPQPLEQVTVPGFRIESDTADQLQRALWARERFAVADLELPNIEIRFHADETGCAGYQGLTTTVNDGEQIDICRTNNYVILHELAHAWEAHALDDDTRASFLALRGLTAWNDATLDWHERGTEHSANIVAWGLTESSIPPIGIHPNDPDSLRQAFHLLTGTTPVDTPASDPPTTTFNIGPGP